MIFDPHKFIASERWTFAKTMPTNPHEYVVRRNCADPLQFDEFVRFIYANGNARVWGGKRFVYWTDAEGKKYWTMGWPTWSPTNTNHANYTSIINRVFPENDKSVEAEDYDTRRNYSGPTGYRPTP
jgi:hypothetical protein